jgi:hypothetical protein
MPSEIRVLIAILVGVVGLDNAGCTFKSHPQDPGGQAGGAGGAEPDTGTGGLGARLGGLGGSIVPPCEGLRCQQTTCVGADCVVPPCSGGAATSISGKVFDPAGKVPLYGVTVFIPNAPLAAIPDGASCVPCATAASGDPVVEATTDAAGEFKLDNVPVGTNIPLVVEVGKWRRRTTVPVVTACIDNPITDPSLTRLPRNKSEGHIPKIALTTGGADALECLLRKIGVDEAEFTPETADGRVNLFAAGTHGGVPIIDNGATSTAGTNAYAVLNGAAKFTDAETWWESADNLKKYDLLLHSCEGVDSLANKSQAARQAFLDYTNMGGRVFASHWHNRWIWSGVAPLPTVATFLNAGDLANPATVNIDTSFPKGMDLATWLLNVGASTTMAELVIRGGKATVSGVNTPLAQRWIYNTGTASVQYFSFNTPVDPPAGQVQCGKVVFSDLHVSAGSGMATDDDSDPKLPFPSGCRTTELSPQEKALEFMLFDLSACTKPGIP